MQCLPQFPDEPFTYAEARALGISQYRFESAVSSREIRGVLRGVYVKGTTADSLDLRMQAAAKVLTPHAVACDRLAAWLHGVDVLDYRELDVIPPLETFVLRGYARINRPECIRGQRDLQPADVCMICGVWVTTPLRTCMDLGAKLSRRKALAVLDAFMRKFNISREDLIRALPRYRRRRGVVQLKELVQLADPRAESTGESWTRIEIIDAGLPTPTPQYWVVAGGRKLYRLDLAYPHAKIAIEYDGREFHEGERNEAADEARREWLRRRGWTVIVVDKDSFTPEAILRWTGEVGRALESSY